MMVSLHGMMVQAILPFLYFAIVVLLAFELSITTYFLTESEKRYADRVRMPNTRTTNRTLHHV